MILVALLYLDTQTSILELPFSILYHAPMCILAILFRSVDNCPVLVAANREEYFDRPGTPPELWDERAAFLAGRDQRGGGTWLGVNAHGVLAAVTNRPKPPLPAPRSRGLLCRDLLACRTAREAHERALHELDRNSYAGCNVLVADAQGAYVVHAGELLRTCPLPPGLHVVTSHDLNDTSDARTAHALARLAHVPSRTIDECLAILPPLLSGHGGAGQPPICLHAPNRGTVSSVIIALPRPPGQPRWLHAQGPPCENPFSDFSKPLASLLSHPLSFVQAKDS